MSKNRIFRIVRVDLSTIVLLFPCQTSIRLGFCVIQRYVLISIYANIFQRIFTFYLSLLSSEKYSKTIIKTFNTYLYNSFFAYFKVKQNK